MNKRAVILGTAIIFGFVLVVLRLADLMLLDHKRLSERAASQYSSRKDLHASRGGIFDRRGRELAVNVDAFSVYVNPRELESPREAASSLARATGQKYKAVLRKVSSDKGFVWVERKVNRDAALKVEALGIDGVGLMPEPERFYPKGQLASHVVGFVGIDNQALEGVELKYDEKLRGKKESVLVLKDAGGRTLSDGMDNDQGGNNIVLTIDEGLQYIVERALDGAMQKWKARSSTAIMMDPHTGEILAMANRPTYDLNDPLSRGASARRNRALTDTYEPGSTFKMITAAGVLEEGLVKSSMKFDCSKGFIRVGKRAIWDTTNHGVLNFKEVIQTSSNVGTVMLGMMLQKERLYDYVRRFGFGKRTGVDLPGESPGKLRPLEDWSETTLAAASIGYGVAVTPLQVLRAYSSIANGGIMVTPHIVREIVTPEGGTLYKFRPEASSRVISQRTADILREILVMVTEKGGTATMASIKGNQVAGKTGTARLIDSETGKYSTERYASSFVGFVPAGSPRLALIVVVFEPQGKYYGGLVAAPVFQEIVEQSLSYLNVPREDDFNRNLLLVRARDVR